MRKPPIHIEKGLMDEEFFYKEAMSFETSDGQDWLVVFDGEIVRLYNMQPGKYHGDKKAELCGTMAISGKEYFEFINNRSLAMVKFARKLLFEIPATEGDSPKAS